MKFNLNFIAMWIVTGVVAVVGMIITKDINCVMLLGIPMYLTLFDMIF